MPFYLEQGSKFNLILAAVTGFVFFSGWWIYIDILANNFDKCAIDTPSIWPGLLGSLMIILTNFVPYRESNDSNLYSTGHCSPVCVIVILFSSYLLAFGACIWGFYVAVQNFILDERLIWPAIGIMIQNLCIVISNLILKFNKEIKYV